MFLLSQATTYAAEANAAAAAMLPAYCDPPNPCPLGYTERDGCIEDFENSSEFSRIYQVYTHTKLSSISMVFKNLKHLAGSQKWSCVPLVENHKSRNHQ